MSENNQPLSIPQKDLDDLKARMNLKMLNMTECAVDSMSNLIHRLESIDNTKVQVEKADEVVETDISPEDAERIKAEILKRGPKAETPVQDAEIVK